MTRAAALTIGLLTGLTTQFAFAQSACDTSCNQQASECMKKCTGDTKEAAKPENSQRLMSCLKQCDTQVKPCRDACTPHK